MQRARQTKIVATLGPASKDRMEELFLAGVDVFRVNFSHTDKEAAQAYLDSVRRLETKFERPIALLADLQGPKLRLGNIAETMVKMDDELCFGDGGLELPHPEIFAAVSAGDVILIDDGRLRITIMDNNGRTLKGRAENAHVMLPRKGINLPGVILPLPALTEKDHADLNTALALGFDWIALSFVQTRADVEQARTLIGNHAKLMVKLEKPSAIEQEELAHIVDLADGVMLARGDLGVEIPIEYVPATQKRVVQYVREQAKPIIVATQMLESMIASPFPTRAEASDVATAIYDGADAIMLSGETASGLYPIEAVAMMDRIARAVEADEEYQDTIHEIRWDTTDMASVVADAASSAAFDLDAKFIVSYTTTGGTARMTARQRPLMKILALTPRASTARQLCLSYGLHPVIIDAPERLSQLAQFASRIALEQGIATPGDIFVMTAGTPFGVEGTTNTMRIASVET